MQPFPPTVIWRHRRENLKKCSLRGLESRKDFTFHRYPGELPNVDGYILLTLDAPELTLSDAHCGLLILDGTWRYAEKMGKALKGDFIRRSLPSHYRTAYPRRQEDCIDPNRGLASIEAIYIAYKILNRDCEHLLDHYHWKEDFLSKEIDDTND